MTETSALLPCPFCGSPARTDLLPHAAGPGWVQCSSCECCQYMSNTLKEAVERWNTRAAAPSPEPVAWMLRAGIHQLDLTWVPSRAALWSSNGGDVRPLYAAPAPQPQPVAWMRSWTDGDSSFSPASRGKPKEIDGTTLTALAPVSQFAENANWSAMRKALEEIVAEIHLNQGGTQGAIRKRALAALQNSPPPRSGSHNSGEAEPAVTQAYGGGEAIFEECAEIAEAHVGAGGTLDHGSLCRISYDDACRDIAEAIRVTASNRKTMDAIAKERK